jgi:hypothetical protein
LACSSELEMDRKDFEIFINRKNREWINRGKFIDLIVWDDFIEAMSKTRLQDEYNIAIRECDVFLALLGTKVGIYTSEEFMTALSQFKTSDKPLIYTYFKDSKVSTGQLNRSELNSLLDFKDKLKELGHFYSTYEDMNALKFNFDRQLEKLVANKFIAVSPGPMNG